MCQGMLVMSNAFLQTAGQVSRSQFIAEEDSDWDAGMENDVVSLLEEMPGSVHWWCGFPISC